MERNVGELDRVVRIIFGILILVSGVALNLFILFVPALILIVTGLTGICPTYKILNINTFTKHFDFPEKLDKSNEPKEELPELPQKSEQEEQQILVKRKIKKK
jgi:hypothetical protein